jgi:hypothetical protein
MTFSFVGGSQDGNEVPVGGPVDLGTEVVLPLQGVPRKGELYVLESDRRFHFHGFRDAAPEEVTTEQVTAWQPSIQKIAEGLQELDAVLAKQGGRRAPIHIGHWTLQPNLDNANRT